MRAITDSETRLRPGRVLIVDDSAVARAVLGRAVTASDRLVIAAAVSAASGALAFLGANEVDIIILDIQMPGVDGLTALPELLAAGRGAKVLIVSAEAGEGATATLRALALGAADTLVKPAPGERSHQFDRELVEKLDRLLNVGRQPFVLPHAVRPSSAPTPGVTEQPFDVVAIGASTGGIHALSLLLRALPASFVTPILVTQHLPASFMPYFAAQLAILGNRPCEVATDRLRLRPGRIVVAPGDAHLRMVALPDGGGAIRLSVDSAASGCLPSVDPMFASIADCFGARALGVVLSGMGRDGVDGARRLAAAGGCVIVQDEASSAVWGMPGAVASAGIASAILAPGALGELIASRRRPI